MKYLIGLGSNLNNKKHNIDSAIKLISQHVKYINKSSIYQTKAHLLKDSPTEWNKDFFNIVISTHTDIKPQEMLTICKQIESSLGRGFNMPRWSPRNIDIDILLIDKQNFKTDSLIVPHPHMLEREFVLIPACDIEPHMVHPITNKTLLNHLSKLSIQQKAQAIRV